MCQETNVEQGNYRMLEHWHRVRSQGYTAMAANEAAADFPSCTLAAFEGHVQLPLMTRAAAAPAEVRALIETIRTRLAALEQLLPGQAATRPAAVSINTETPMPCADGDDIGRNQRSRVRELVLLEALEAEHHALALPQLTRALNESGFDDTSAAIVSQLHRLKKIDVISQPANGMYALTQAGVLHVRELRRNFGHLKGR